jgi:hypothetical protein
MGVPDILKTNTLMPKKRAPGGGRKPKGEFAGKAATFTTRITNETRTALERGARKRGVSLSQHVEFLLKAAMHKPTASQLRNQALGRAITILAENIERDTGRSWRDDAFTGQSLRYAVEALLFHFTPTLPDPLTLPKPVDDRAAKMPEEFADRYRTPAGLGHMAAFAMIAEIESAARSTIDEWSVPINLHVPDDYVQLLGRELGAKRGGKQ